MTRERTSNLTTAANEFVCSGLQPWKARYGSRGTTTPVLAIEALSATVVLYTHLTSRLKPVVLQNGWSCRRWEHGEAACGALAMALAAVVGRAAAAHQVLVEAGQAGGG